eukprot:m.169027 g.169027  ORF g.169027 m.169027 type:complete len:187 (+) comp9915_c1_seq7:93-653(+)
MRACTCDFSYATVMQTCTCLQSWYGLVGPCVRVLFRARVFLALHHLLTLAEDDKGARQGTADWKTALRTAMRVHCMSEADRKEHRCASLDRTGFNPDYPGQSFPFVNREAESMEMLVAFYELERLRRMDGDYEVLKRECSIPLTAGQPGMGKSRFAREFMLHLAAKEIGKQDPTREELLNTAPTLP